MENSSDLGEVRVSRDLLLGPPAKEHPVNLLCHKTIHNFEINTLTDRNGLDLSLETVAMSPNLKAKLKHPK